ncbi:MAG: hypothetical protein LBD85_06655 [Oscillospiraceae bacterium]|jgi:hypothetical protein|nr:hypothetical protein [Oscillospiraceae bacterium]
MFSGSSAERLFAFGFAAASRRKLSSNRFCTGQKSTIAFPGYLQMVRKIFNLTRKVVADTEYHTAKSHGVEHPAPESRIGTNFIR